MTEESKKKYEEILQKTIEEAMSLLKTHHLCGVERPPGFGKTWMASKVARTYKKVLYLYPSYPVKEAVQKSIEYRNISGFNIISWADVFQNIEEVYEDVIKEDFAKDDMDISNITFMTYMKFIRLTEEQIAVLKQTYDLIICDECHLAGAEKTREALRKLFDGIDADIFGLTATPLRTDRMDVFTEFFENHTVFSYTVEDGFRDGIFLEPYYTYCMTDLNDTILATLKELYPSLPESDLADMVEKFDADHKVNRANIKHIPKVLKEAVVSDVKDASCMKYIVFFPKVSVKDEYKKPDVVTLRKNMPTVVEWFKEAFPDYTIKVLVVTSKTAQETNNIRLVDHLPREDKTIYLICCVDMLNLGAHIDDLTGIVMYRKTTSNLIYTQQFGRVLSVGQEERRIVIDVVDNLHRKTKYNDEQSESINGMYGYTAKDDFHDKIMRILPKEYIAIGCPADIKEYLAKLIDSVKEERLNLVNEAISKSGVQSQLSDVVLAEILSYHRLTLDDYRIYQKKSA